MITTHLIKKVYIPYGIIGRFQNDFLFCPLEYLLKTMELFAKKIYLLNLMKEMGVSYEKQEERFVTSSTNNNNILI